MPYISLLPRRILTESWASLQSGWQNLDLCTLDYESLQIFATCLYVCVFIKRKENEYPLVTFWSTSMALLPLYQSVAICERKSKHLDGLITAVLRAVSWRKRLSKHIDWNPQTHFESILSTTTSTLWPQHTLDLWTTTLVLHWPVCLTDWKWPKSC